MKKGHVAILVLFVLFLYCYDFILRLTLYPFMNMIAYIFMAIFPDMVISSEKVELNFEDIFAFFFETRYPFATFPYGMPLFIWSIFFMIIVTLYIYIITKCFINEKIKIFINMKIINIALIPFWIINYFIIFHDGLSVSFGMLMFFSLGGFFAMIVLIGISYIFQILVSLPSILYINFLYKTHSIKIIECLLHTILQFVIVLGLFDSIYLIKYNRKANVA
jgi:hypothetical protein